MELQGFGFSVMQLVVNFGELGLDRPTFAITFFHSEEADFFSPFLLFVFSGLDLIHSFLSFSSDLFGARILLLHEFLVIMFGFEIVFQIFFAPVFCNPCQPFVL